MKLINKENKLELIIRESLLEQIANLAVKEYPNEFGGFLIGHYINNFRTLEITDIILPLRYVASPLSFLRLTNDLENAFYSAFNTRGHYYVGEWHSHPNGSSMYSQTDLNAMNEIAGCKAVSITNPILLILSIDSKGMNKFTFYCYNNNKRLIPYG